MGVSQTCHNVTTFGGHKPCDNRDIIHNLLNFIRVVQGFPIKGSCDLLDGSYSLCVMTLPILFNINLLVLEDIIHFIFYLTSQGYVIKGAKLWM